LPTTSTRPSSSTTTEDISEDIPGDKEAATTAAAITIRGAVGVDEAGTTPEGVAGEVTSSLADRAISRTKVFEDEEKKIELKMFENGMKNSN